MKLVIDLQACQTSGSRDRGIGRYSFALADAMLRGARGHHVRIALNWSFPDTVDYLTDHFSSLIPRENILVWGGMHATAEADPANSGRRLAAERVKAAFFHSLAADAIHTTSLFEGLGDESVTSIGYGITPVEAVTLYDLIPYIRAETYLANDRVEDWYRRKVLQLRQADLSLAISESSRREGIEELGLAEDSVVNISCAVDSKFHVIKDIALKEASIRAHYRLDKPFVMYTGGIDFRKNIEGLIVAYAKLPPALRAEHQLAIVCRASAHDQARLRAISHSAGLQDRDVVFTGFVSDEDLAILYNICKLFIFPSLHEGFGLPALEAMSCGAAVIGSNCTSIPEVIGRADALFDPTSEESIATKLVEVLRNDAFLTSLRTTGLARAKQFSWERSASLSWDALEARLARTSKSDNSSRSVVSVLPRAPRPRLACVSPLPPDKSGIAGYSAELLPLLSSHYEIDVVHDGVVTDPWIRRNVTVVTCAQFEASPERYDRVLYHFGNSQFHTEMPRLLSKIPGTVVLHDFFLSGLFWTLQATGRDSRALDTEIEHSHGIIGLLEHLSAASPERSTTKYPCSLSILENANGIISHSQYSRELAHSWYGPEASSRWQVLPLLRNRSTGLVAKDEARAQLNLPTAAFVVCSFGMVSPAFKLNDVIVEAWAQSQLGSQDNCRLVFVGAPTDRASFDERIATLVSEGRIAHCLTTGYVTDAEYELWISACDVCVQLRAQSRGETSAAVFDGMAAGKQVIINSHATLNEVPSEHVVKVSEYVSPRELANVLETSYADPCARELIGKHAADYVRQYHGPETVTSGYVAAIEAFATAAANQKTTEVLADIRALQCAQIRSTDWTDIRRHLDAALLPDAMTKRTFIDVTSRLDELFSLEWGGGLKTVLGLLLALFPPNSRVFFVRQLPDGGYRIIRDFAYLLSGTTKRDSTSEPDVTLFPGEYPMLLENFGAKFSTLGRV
jgi:glycosyltransferase involved in cell wall biosynthesis